MKYAHLEENTNKILGWYDSDIHDNIPTPNRKVSNEVWKDAINNNANFYNGSSFERKDFRTDKEKEEALISEFKSIYLRIFKDKLKELDYDSISTVQFWANNEEFGEEAKSILKWYENIILTHYDILNKINEGDIEIPSKEQYINMLPKIN